MGSNMPSRLRGPYAFGMLDLCLLIRAPGFIRASIFYFISSHKFLRRRHAAYGLVPSPSVVKSVPTFLNRVLAMGMDDQELIFRYFSNTMDALIASAKSTGRYEHGPINLQASGVEVARRQIVHREPGTGACKKFESKFVSQTR